MNFIQYDELGITAAVIAAALAFLILVWNAVKAIRDWRELARKPTTDTLADHGVRIHKLEEHMGDVNRKLDADREFRQDELAFNRLMLKSVRYLLAHQIDGNDVDGLRQMAHEIDKYLLEGMGK